MRKKAKRLLDDVGCKTNSRTNEFISGMIQYSPTEIDRAFVIWTQGGYAFSGKDERYFLGILKHNSIDMNPVLDSLPPVAPYPEEVDRESKDGDEVSTGIGMQSKDEQELPITDRCIEKDGRPVCDCHRGSDSGIDGSGQSDDTRGSGA
ncbi:MAG: hypothetical protein ACTSVR_03105 [Candidatus Thorarchaeota archaeon]